MVRSMPPHAIAKPSYRTPAGTPTQPQRRDTSLLGDVGEVAQVAGKAEGDRTRGDEETNDHHPADEKAT